MMAGRGRSRARRTRSCGKSRAEGRISSRSDSPPQEAEAQSKSRPPPRVHMRRSESKLPAGAGWLGAGGAGREGSRAKRAHPAEHTPQSGPSNPSAHVLPLVSRGPGISWGMRARASSSGEGSHGRVRGWNLGTGARRGSQRQAVGSSHRSSARPGSGQHVRAEGGLRTAHRPLLLRLVQRACGSVHLESGADVLPHRSRNSQLSG